MHERARREPRSQVEPGLESYRAPLFLPERKSSDGNGYIDASRLVPGMLQGSSKTSTSLPKHINAGAS